MTNQKGEADSEAIGGIVILIVIGGVLNIIYEGINYVFEQISQFMDKYLWIILTWTGIIICMIIVVYALIYFIAHLIDLHNEGKIKKQTLILILGTSVVFLISSILLGKSWYENRPDQQIARMIDVQEKLQKQIGDIQTTKNEYQKQLQSLKEEIQEAKRSNGISSLANATERMNYNIRLIQEQDAYWFKLSEIEMVTKKGLEEAVYMKRKLEARKLMTKVVADGKNLGSDIDTLLKTYSPYTNEVAINPKELKFKSPEEVWQIYVK